MDVSQRDKMEQRDWSSEAPDWRICYPGLWEGKCTNSTCPAYNRQVIMSNHFEAFDQLKSTRCPMCAEYVKPTTCSFNNCHWKFEGIKSGLFGKKHVTGEWMECDSFKEAESFTWDRLLISVIPLGRQGLFTGFEDPECSICLESIEESDMKQL